MKWLTLMYMVAVAAIVGAANFGALPLWLKSLYRFPGGDKAGHCILLGLLAAAVNGFLRYKTLHLLSRPVFVGTLIVLAAVTLEELSQAFIASRTCSLADLASSYLGIILADRYAAWRRPQPDTERTAL
jgi:hypothetical protein